MPQNMTPVIGEIAGHNRSVGYMLASFGFPLLNWGKFL